MEDMKNLANQETAETERIVENAYVFDVDGVLTDPAEKIFDRDIMTEIVEKLKNKEPVILNTGRSIAWLQERIVARLYHAHNLTDKTALQYLFMIGEKGGTWIEYRENGIMSSHPKKDTSISVPEDLQANVKKLIDNEFSKTMFFDNTKQTMISTEMKQGVPLDQYHETQTKLVEDLNILIRKRHLEDKYVVDPTTIATDVQNKHVGKDFAMQRAIDWLKQKRITPKNYITFGDSTSDFAMARQLFNAGMSVEHIHVGESEIPSDLPFPVIRTNAHYNNGTKEFLQER